MTNYIDYSQWPVAVRDDLLNAHIRAWTRLASPGTWLTGAQRIAVAAETRQAVQCELCAMRKTALSPNAGNDPHDVATDLPPALVEVIHRVRNDASRMTESFYQSILAQGVRDGEYVETVGVMANVIAIDSFALAMGQPVPELPKPVAGEPARRRPPGAKHGLAWVPTVAPEDVTENETDLYKDLAGVNIHRALSLVPAEVRGFFDLDFVHYLPDAALRDFAHEYRDLSHAQIEYLAARVSAINQCEY